MCRPYSLGAETHELPELPWYKVGVDIFEIQILSPHHTETLLAKLSCSRWWCYCRVVLSKDTSTSSLEELRIETLTLGFVDDCCTNWAPCCPNMMFQRKCSLNMCHFSALKCVSLLKPGELGNQWDKNDMQYNDTQRGWSKPSRLSRPIRSLPSAADSKKHTGHNMLLGHVLMSETLQ